MIKTITETNFKQLLQAFSADESEAGAAYTKLRNSLVRFFQLKGISDPDKAADETIDRVTVKISQGNEIDDLTNYSFGVARFIFLEKLRMEKKEVQAAEGFHNNYFNRAATEEVSLSFRFCFDALADEEKAVLQNYFADIPFPRLVVRRQQMSDKSNISLNNLRLKVFRLRKRLEDCVKEQLGR